MPHEARVEHDKAGQALGHTAPRYIVTMKGGQTAAAEQRLAELESQRPGADILLETIAGVHVG